MLQPGYAGRDKTKETLSLLPSTVPFADLETLKSNFFFGCLAGGLAEARL